MPFAIAAPLSPTVDVPPDQRGLPGLEVQAVVREPSALWASPAVRPASTMAGAFQRGSPGRPTAGRCPPVPRPPHQHPRCSGCAARSRPSRRLPLPVITADSFIPNAFTRIPRPARLHREQGTSLTTSVSTPPGSDSTMARIVMDAPELMNPSGRFRHTSMGPRPGQRDRDAGPSLVPRLAQLVGEPGDDVFGRGDGAEQLLLPAGVGDIAARVEPAEHRGHVLDHRHEAADDGS